jgi:hypothetical protein
MSNSTNQNQVITEYLLGGLPELEMERLDELSVTSQEFAEVLSASEKDLIDAYVQGELSGTMLAQFESHYLASPIRRERVAFAEAFQVFTRTQKVVDDSSIRGQADLHRGQKKGWLSTLNIFGLQWGLAVATVIFIVAVAFLLVQNVRLRQQISQEQARRDELQQREMQLQKELDQQRVGNKAIEQELAQLREERVRLEEKLKSGLPASETAIVSFVLSPQLRGVGQAQSISIAANTDRVTMRLNLEPNDYQTFAVALLDQSNHQELWQSGKLKASSRGDDRTLNVSFSAALLRPQEYALQISGISKNGQSEVLSDYPFKVVKY